MKWIILLVVFLLIAGPAMADFTVYYVTNTEEILFMGDAKNIILSLEDQSILSSVVMRGEIEDYALTEDLYDYKIINGKFVINTKKISDRENAVIDNQATSDQKDIDFLTAKDKLMVLGLTGDEVDSLK